MAGNFQNNDDDEITGINVTPLVDVMMVLLIVFMVTASYIVQKSIEVKLPKAETASDTNTTRNLAFVVDKEAHLYLDGASLTWEEVAERITQAKQASTHKGESLQALISADESTPHGLVVKLIDAVRKNGITDFAINVEAAPAPAAGKDTAKERAAPAGAKPVDDTKKP